MSCGSVGRMIEERSSRKSLMEQLQVVITPCFIIRSYPSQQEFASGDTIGTWVVIKSYLIYLPTYSVITNITWWISVAKRDFFFLNEHPGAFSAANLCIHSFLFQVQRRDVSQFFMFPSVCRARQCHLCKTARTSQRSSEVLFFNCPVSMQAFWCFSYSELQYLNSGFSFFLWSEWGSSSALINFLENCL